MKICRSRFVTFENPRQKPFSGPTPARFSRDSERNNVIARNDPGTSEAEAMSKRRWMKWITEADAEEITLPWARGNQRQTRKFRAKCRAVSRAA
jgi:hypothetical protein